jgi:hypothetical protein
MCGIPYAVRRMTAIGAGFLDFAVLRWLAPSAGSAPLAAIETAVARPMQALLRRMARTV